MQENNRGLISVIIPVYNVEQYVQRCLDSIYRNTYKNLEIICVDDGSTDGSLEILKAQIDERVVVIDKPNGGVSSARNAGMKAATGEYIAFVDPDDWVHSRYFEYLVRAIDSCDIACCSFQRVCEWGEEEDIAFLPPQMFSEVEAENIHDARDTVWGKIYSIHLLRDVYFHEEICMAEDRVFNLEVLSKRCNVAVIPVKLYFYYSRPDSLVHINGTKFLPPSRAIFQLMLKTNRASTIEQTFRMLLACRYLNMFKHNAREITREVNMMLATCKKRGKTSLPLKERIVLNVLADFPILYRLWRIKGDRTMIQWEREEKRKKSLIRDADV